MVVGVESQMLEHLVVASQFGRVGGRLEVRQSKAVKELDHRLGYRVQR